MSKKVPLTSIKRPRIIDTRKLADDANQLINVQKMSMPQVCKILGVSHCPIRKYMKEYGYTLNDTRGRPRLNREVILEAYKDSNKTVNEIAKELGVSAASVINTANKAGLRRRFGIGNKEGYSKWKKDPNIPSDKKYFLTLSNKKSVFILADLKKQVDKLASLRKISQQAFVADAIEHYIKHLNATEGANETKELTP